MLPTAADFYLRIPIYEFHEVTDENCGGIQDIVYRKDHVDAFCIYCDQDSVFHRTYPDTNPTLTKYQCQHVGRFSVQLTCARNANHAYFFVFQGNGREVGKIGQYPSLADLNTNQLGRYRKTLGNERWLELNRGVGLAAHGVGIGAFVYLRRVFEHLIEEAHNQLKAGSAWNEDEYQRVRMDEKIQMLRSKLPQFLVENRGLYAILSTGIHLLTEVDCLRYFDTVRVGIELILDERLAIEVQNAKLVEAAKAINRTRGDITR